MPTRTITKAEEESIKAHAKKQKNTLIKAEEEAEAKKQKKKRPDRAIANGLQVQPGDNTKYLTHNMELYALSKVDLDSVEQVEDRSMEYFQICAKNDMKPSVAGYALALGYSRAYVWELCNKPHENKKPEVIDTIKRVMEALTAQMEDYMQNGKINPVSGIFLMKNNMGYQDKQEVVVTPNQVNEVSENNLLEESNLLPED